MTFLFAIGEKLESLFLEKSVESAAFVLFEKLYSSFQKLQEINHLIINNC